MKNILIKQCLSCNEDFEVLYYLRNSVVACSKYCSNRLITLRKLRGIYLQCNMCDRLVYKERTKVRKKNFCSRKCDHLYRKTVHSLNPPANILENRKKYYGENWRFITRKVRSEQNYNCMDCGINEVDYGQALSVHHIVPFTTFNTIEEANKRTNLVGVCERCHRKRHSGEGHIKRLNKSDLGANAYSDYGKTTSKHRTEAKAVVKLLKQTNLTLAEISRQIGVSYATVRRIYKGERWTEYYDSPPYITNPRAKVNNLKKFTYIG